MTAAWEANLAPLADEKYRYKTWERIQKRIAVSPTGCWEWQLSTVDGYGQISVGKKIVAVHRVALAIARGAGWPRHLQVDHLCRNRVCCNPEHLELVSGAENTRRGISGEINGERQRRKTHCPQGHSYKEHGYAHPKTGHRHCKTCRAAGERKRKDRERDERMSYVRWSA